MKSYSSNYTPRGAYSFEFVDNNNNTITEIFFSLPPENISVTEKTRAEVLKTIGGGYVSDFGNDFKEITIHGSLHFYQVLSRINPLAAQWNFHDSDEMFLIDGYSEFEKIRYALIRYRDYTLTPKNKTGNELFFDLARLDTLILKEHVNKKKDALYPKIEMVFHDYDLDEHWKVLVNSFNVSRDKSDPFSVKYEISLTAYEKHLSLPHTGFSEIKKSVYDILLDYENLRKQIQEMTIILDPPDYDINRITIQDAFNLFLPNLDISEINFDSELYQLNQKIRLTLFYISAAINDVRSGRSNLEDALTNAYNQIKNL